MAGAGSRDNQGSKSRVTEGNSQGANGSGMIGDIPLSQAERAREGTRACSAVDFVDRLVPGLFRGICVSLQPISPCLRVCYEVCSRLLARSWAPVRGAVFHLQCHVWWCAEQIRRNQERLRELGLHDPKALLRKEGHGSTLDEIDAKKQEVRP